MFSELLTKRLQQLPSLPGVYKMLNQEGDVLYVGKARQLKKRVASYFNRSNKGAKTQALVSQIADIEVTVTESETEALILESNLIKRLKPKYNILLRDDKTYPYVIVTTEQAYPRIDIVRSKSKPKAGNYFGPYPSVGSVKETLLLLQKIFRLRTCRDSNFKSRTRPCLQYQIKRCSAPCVQLIEQERYAQSVKHAVAFLQGKNQQLIERLEQSMDEASRGLNYEQAAILRDQIKSLREVQQQQYVNQGDVDADVVAIHLESVVCVQVLSVRQGQVIANNAYFPKMPTEWRQQFKQEHAACVIFEAFIAQHYLIHPERIPTEIIALQQEQSAGLIEALSQVRGKACKFTVNPRGVKAKWCEMTQRNLDISVSSYLNSQQKIAERYAALQQLLECRGKLQRLECFDISHTQGEATIASCVVFGPEGALRQDYRRFNITGVTPGDDYAAMKQALHRRYRRLVDKQAKLPDVLFIDGGKGQVKQALAVFDELGITGVKLVGVAKGPGRKAGWETLILTDTSQVINLPVDAPALHLIQQIRDEAHRFAITAHRLKRHKARFESQLEQVEGIGAKKRQALLKRFGSVKAIASAPLEELSKVNGISLKLAEKIHQVLRNE